MVLREVTCNAMTDEERRNSGGGASMRVCSLAHQSQLGDVQLFGHGRLPASIDVACSVCRGEIVSEFAKSMDVGV